ncbi:hypothetical protein F4780DRAFT_542396 [Xylariomycetidae sp. FL0641]|nr:hypothetical protein F4780DRAFT_542396 [Xylariomycetidae sp. FL0641]
MQNCIGQMLPSSSSSSTLRISVIRPGRWHSQVRAAWSWLGSDRPSGSSASLLLLSAIVRSAVLSDSPIIAETDKDGPAGSDAKRRGDGSEAGTRSPVVGRWRRIRRGSTLRPFPAAELCGDARRGWDASGTREGSASVAPMEISRGEASRVVGGNRCNGGAVEQRIGCRVVVLLVG